MGSWVLIKETWYYTYARVEDEVMKRGAELDRSLRGKTDEKSLRKLELLADMVKRASARNGI